MQAAFWVTPNLGDAQTLAESFVDFARPAAAAFVRHGVQRVVGISALGRDTPEAAHAGYVTASLEMDDLFAACGVAYRAMVNPSFMDNLLNQAGAIKQQGKWFGTALSDLKAPAVATGDIAAVSAELLTQLDWTGFEEVACLGPQELSATDQAQIVSEVLGTDVAYVQIPDQAFKDRMTGFGMSDAMAQGMVDMFEAKNRGLDNGQPRTDAAATPTTFAQWCEDVLKPAVAAA